MPGRAILIYGNDTFRVEKRVKELIAESLPPDAIAVGLETFDGRVDGAAAAQIVGSCIQSLQSVSLFGGNRVVLLKEATFVAAKGGGRGDDEGGGADCGAESGAKGAATELAAQVRRGMPDGIAFLLTAPEIDKRSALYKAFDSAGKIEALQISEKSWEAEKQAHAFLDERVKALGIRVAEDAKRALLARCGADTLTLASELEKLALYAGEKTVTAADVAAVSAPSREAIVWELTDAIGARKPDEALAVMRQLLFQGESPMALMAVLEGYFRQLAVARDVLDRKMARAGYRDLEWRALSPEESAMLDSLGKMDLRKMNPFRAQKLAQQASVRTAANIRRCRRVILNAHERLVSSSIPQPLTLDIMLCQLLT